MIGCMRAFPLVLLLVLGCGDDADALDAGGEDAHAIDAGDDSDATPDDATAPDGDMDSDAADSGADAPLDVTAADVMPDDRPSSEGLIACPDPRAEQVLTIYECAGHNTWARTYDLSAGNDIYTWLLSKRR